MLPVFYIAGTIAILATVMVITRLNAVHALLYLVVSLLAVALCFYTLGAPLVAALEVIIYAGAIMVLFVFVIMLLNLGEAAVAQEREWLKPQTWLGPTVLCLLLFVGFLAVIFSGETQAFTQKRVSPKQVGISLFTTYLFAVELAAMLLLAALVGAYHITKGIEEETKRGAQ